MRLEMKFHYLLTLSLLGFMLSCMQEPTRAGQKLIDRKLASTLDYCRLTMLITDLTVCEEACPVNTHVASEAEVTDYFTTANWSEGEIATYKDQTTYADAVCIPDVVEIKRPSGGIKIASNFCSCIAGAVDIVTNSACAAVCKSKPKIEKAMMYGSVTLSDEIVAEFGNLYNWCNTAIDDGLGVPSCNLWVKDSNQNSSRIRLVTYPGTNNFAAELLDDNAPKEVTLQMTIEELSSGAISDTVQFYRINQPGPEEVLGTLAVKPINLYTCMMRSMRTDNSGAVYYDLIVPMHYIYPEGDSPDSLPANSINQIICHDPQKYPGYDHPEKPRLELVPGHLALWSKSDPRMVCATTSNAGLSCSPDINSILTRRLINEYGAASTTNISVFYYLPGQPGPVIESSGTTTTSTSPGNYAQGVALKSWINSTTQKNYCPTQTQYNGTNSLFRLLKEYVGVDTEALYISKREPMSLKDASGAIQSAPADYMYIRESQLKRIWFYLDGNKRVVPTESDAGTKAIMFFWPPATGTQDPLVKQSNQIIYTIKSAADISGSSIPTANSSHDKRIGCVPKLEE